MGYMSSSEKLSSPKVVKNLLRQHSLQPRKRYGQNFLCDENTLLKIIDGADLQSSDNVFEIGGGLGTLTEQIASSAQNVVVVEIDHDLLPIITANLERFSNVDLINEDVLNLDWGVLFPDNQRYKTLGNLPYNITAPLLEKLIEHRARIECAIWMMQLEVAQKITASPGTRESSSLGVFVQSYCDVEQLMRVSRNAFYPKPEVDSAVLKIQPLRHPRFQSNPTMFNRVVRAAYGMRRKTLLKALSLSPDLGLSKEVIENVLADLGIDGVRRGETLVIAEFD